MSRTHKDRPYRIRSQDTHLRSRYVSAPRWFVKAKFNRPERQLAKRQLRAGTEPFPHQPRGRASWDYEARRVS